MARKAVGKVAKCSVDKELDTENNSDTDSSRDETN